MDRIQNKSTKTIRVILIIVFLIQIILTAFPFIWSEGAFKDLNTSNSESTTSWICSSCGVENPPETTQCKSCNALRKSTFTALDMIMYIGASTGNHDADNVLNVMGMCFMSFLLLPLIAVLFQIFDRYYNWKNIVGLICSGLGVICVIYFVEGYLCLGSLLSLLMYLVSFFFCVMGIFARLLQTPNTAPQKSK